MIRIKVADYLKWIHGKSIQWKSEKRDKALPCAKMFADPIGSCPLSDSSVGLDKKRNALRLISTLISPSVIL